MGNSDKFNLRTMEISASSAKNVEQTSMLDGIAREVYATGTNETNEYITATKSPGQLGAEGKN